MNDNPAPLFEAHTKATLDRVDKLVSQRGTEYSDGWRDCDWITLKAVARKLNIAIPDNAIRAIAAAALVDVKHQRNQGGFKDDNLIDGIAYMAVLAEEMRITETPVAPEAPWVLVKDKLPVEDRELHFATHVTFTAIGVFRDGKFWSKGYAWTPNMIARWRYVD